MGIRDRALAARKTQEDRDATKKRKNDEKFFRTGRRELSQLLQTRIREEEVSWSSVVSQYGHYRPAVTYDGVQFIYYAGYSPCFSMRVGDREMDVACLSDVGKYLLLIEAANPEITEFERLRSTLIEKYS